MIKLILHPNQELEQSVELESRTLLIGRSDENDLTIDDPSVASLHVRLEKRGEQFIIKDLSKQGILVDGEEVHEAPIHVGSIITLGDVEILFKGETAVGPGVEEGVLLGEAEPGPEEGALVTTPGGAGAGAYLPTETFIQPAHIEPERSIASTLSLVSFIAGALGPLLLGIGWLLGIILGFVSLANIRRRGGLLKDKRMAVWGINLGFVWVVLAFGLLAWRGWVGGVESTIRRGEKSAREVLQGICVTQYYARYGHFFDTNGNGAPEYGTIEDLDSLRYSGMPDIKRDLRGYELVMDRADEGGFLCYAKPKIYGRTGRNTYAIDERGVLCGKDLRGADFADTDRDLPPVGQGKSVLETRGERIAQDLVEVAKRVAAENDYMRATRVVEATRETFPLTDAVKKVLDAVDAEVDPQVVEIRSVEEYNKGLALVEQGEVVRALEVLKLAEKNYPTSSHIEKIREQIALIHEQHFKVLEAAAEEIYNDAQKLELAGKFTEAKQRYMKIQDQYSITTYGEGIEEQINKIEEKIREVEAAGFVAKLRALTPNKDYVEIVRIVELLKRRYAQTDEYERNYEMIELAEHKGRAYNEAVQAVRALREHKYESALASFEKALGEYADIQPQIKPYLEECYFEAGMSAFKRRDFRSALGLFTRYRRLSPKENKLHELYLMRAYYEVGKLDYQQGDLEAAEQKLFVCSRQFERDAEFNYIYGSVLMGRTDYKRAVEYLTRYFQYSSADADKRYYAPSLRKRGYSEVQLAALLESEVRDLVLANAVYRPLIDEEALSAGKEDEPAAEEPAEEPEDERDDDDDDYEEFDPGDFGGGLPGRGGAVLAQAINEAGDDNGNGDGEADEEETVKEPALRRILNFIVEVLEAESQLRKEDQAAVGDSARRERIEIKRTRMIEDFQQRQANLRIGIDRENRSKLEIIRRLERAVVYLNDGINDLNTVNSISSRNRDLDKVIEKLVYKRRMFAAAHTHLFTAYRQDLKIQTDAYALLGRALKEFSGWPDPRDLGKSLRAMFMMKPGTEQVAEGLRALLKGFDVETDLDIILRSGGEPDL